MTKGVGRGRRLHGASTLDEQQRQTGMADAARARPPSENIWRVRCELATDATRAGGRSGRMDGRTELRANAGENWRNAGAAAAICRSKEGSLSDCSAAPSVPPPPPPPHSHRFHWLTSENSESLPRGAAAMFALPFAASGGQYCISSASEQVEYENLGSKRSEAMSVSLMLGMGLEISDQV